MIEFIEARNGLYFLEKLFWSMGMLLFPLKF